LIYTLAHHKEQQTNVHNLKTTKHKKNRKEVKERSVTSSNAHDHQPSPSSVFFAGHIQHNKSFIRANFPHIILLRLSHAIEFSDIDPGHNIISW
jgi:hypothetical protein